MKSVGNSQPVLILGMHRSGTSFLAHFLQSLGVSIGDDLVGPQRGNPRGHYEDRELLEFHQKALAKRPDSGFRLHDDGMMRQSPLLFEPDSDEEAEANAILEKRQRSGLWGWKEPRTCLFIDFWMKKLPDLKVVWVYRHPWEVHASMLRRQHWDLALEPTQVFKAYEVYNEALLKAHEKAPEQFYILNANAAFRNLEELASALCGFLGIPESTGELAEFHRNEFHSLPLSQQWHALFADILPETADCFDRIQRVADLPLAFATTASDEDMEALHKALRPFLETLEPAGRSGLVPLLEVLFEGKGALNALESRKALRDGIVRQKTEIDKWREGMLESWERQQKLIDERENAYQEQVRKTHAVWQELQEVGKSWKELREMVIRQQEHIQHLQKAVSAKKEPSASP